MLAVDFAPTDVKTAGGVLPAWVHGTVVENRYQMLSDAVKLSVGESVDFGFQQSWMLLTEPLRNIPADDVDGCSYPDVKTSL